MKSFWIVGIGLLPLVAGCSVFETNPVPPNPALTGVSAQDAAWKDQIKQVRGGDGARFEPLEDARDALARASAEQGVENYDAEALASARQALDAAESAWGVAIGYLEDPHAHLPVGIPCRARLARMAACVLARGFSRMKRWTSS